MSTLPSDAAIGPRIIQCAKYDVPDEDFADRNLPVELSYLRVLSTLSTFLSHDTATISEDDAQPLEEDPLRFQERFVPFAETGVCHHWIRLQHPMLSFSTFYIHPERDILWLGHETETEDLEELSSYYGAQLSTVQNVLFEQSEWDDLDESLRKLERFHGIRVIYVWLDGFRFLPGATVTNQQGYLKKAAEFQARDRRALFGRNLMVEYLDHENNIYGGFRANVAE
ncbi:hypothetical protein MANI_024520 [Metarhizium anisopliae]